MSICKKCIQSEQVRKKFTPAKAKKGEKGEQKTFKLKRHYPTPLTFLMVCHLKDNQLIPTINVDGLIDPFIFIARWVEYTPQWCGRSNRRNIARRLSLTLEECKKLCAGCPAIEYWSGRNKECNKCLDHTKRRSFTNTGDSYYPPHVFIWE